MSDMPMSDSLPPEGLNEGVPEGEPAPMPAEVDPAEGMGGVPVDPSQGPPMVDAPADPMMTPPPVGPVLDDAEELELRDELTMQLMVSAIKLTNAVEVSIGGNMAQDAERYASAAQHLTQAAVLLAPQEAIDDAVAGGGDPAVASQVWNSTVKGVRRKAGS